MFGDCLRSVTQRRHFVAFATGVALLAAGCGALRSTDHEGQAPGGKVLAGKRKLGPRYGVALTLPTGWDGQLGRGAVHAASFPLPGSLSAWAPNAIKKLKTGDLLVSVFENESQRSPPLDLAQYRKLSGQMRLDSNDFKSFDAITEDSRASGHGYARRMFQVSGRFFVLFVEAGERVPSPSQLGALNEFLGSLTVQAGDFVPGTVEPARFSHRTGWFVGTSGVDEARADGEFTSSWASTIPYADEWNALPQKTLGRLPRDGIVIWLGLSRSNRFPPDRGGSKTVQEPPFLLSHFEQRAGWEGQVRDLPEYVLWGTVHRQYQVDLHVYFGQPDPSKPMLDKAQAMLDGVLLPDWGPWETQ
jgi:hypothetical protein